MANGSFNSLFQTCVAEAGPAYRSARDQLLAMSDVILPQLEELAMETEWRTVTTAQILIGWLTNRTLFEEAMSAAAATPPQGTASQPITGKRSPTRRATIFASFGEAVVPLLIEIAVKTGDTGDADRRQAALLALEYLRDERAVMPLTDLAERTESPGLQSYTLAVLGSIGDDRATDVARRVFADRTKGTSVRGAAAVALGQFHDSDSTPALLAAARDPNESGLIRENAVRALGYMNDATVSSALANLLNEPQDERLSLALVSALNNIHDQDAIAALERTSRTANNVAVRKAAADALLA